jgi:hypothetical protein
VQNHIGVRLVWCMAGLSGSEVGEMLRKLQRGPGDSALVDDHCQRSAGAAARRSPSWLPLPRLRQVLQW